LYTICKYKGSNLTVELLNASNDWSFAISLGNALPGEGAVISFVLVHAIKNMIKKMGKNFLSKFDFFITRLFKTIFNYMVDNLKVKNQ
jgi:hypothetical protein